MERLYASSDLWPDITVRTGDDETTYSIGLELTYSFDPNERKMAIAIRGMVPDKDTDITDRKLWREVYLLTGNPSVVFVFASNLGTARRLTAEMGLPQTAAFAVREHLEAMASKLDPFVHDAFLGRAMQPEEVAPQPEPATAPSGTERNNVLVTIDRDVSGVFGMKEGSYTLEYTLFNEPKSFRAVIMAHRAGGPSKAMEFYKNSVLSVISHFNSDALAHEIASYFGDTNSRRVALISAVLKLSFGMNTGLAKDVPSISSFPTRALTAQPSPPPVAIRNPQTTQTLPSLKAVRPSTFTVFNTGDYFEVPN